MNAFQDHFSSQSATYASARPEYPDALFAWLAAQCTHNQRVWDCACGTGQASRGLAGYFDQVDATDASEQQIAQAQGPDNVRFRVATAYDSGLPDHGVDAVCVAQALHWFDLQAFHREALRVIKPQGLIVAWCYGLQRIDIAAIQQAVMHYYDDVVGPYWPAERRHIESGYRDLPTPCTEIDTPELSIEQHWTLDHLLGYLESWSATQRYQSEHGESPLPDLRQTLQACWPSDQERIHLSWPITLKACRAA